MKGGYGVSDTHHPDGRRRPILTCPLPRRWRQSSPRLMFPSYPPVIIKAANSAAYQRGKPFLLALDLLERCWPLLLYGAVPAPVEGGQSGFWRFT